ncbi:MAG: hypothetical protein E7211_05440 [Clostridium lundense]|nr:hypothetical protein [Clostridium lundense]
MKKILKTLFLTLIIIMLLIAGAMILAFNKQGYTLRNSPTENILNKITAAEKDGKTISLTSEEINSLLSVVYKNPKQKGNIIVKTPQIELEGDKMIAKVPVTYNSIQVVLWTKGSIEQNGDHIIYLPDSFKIGKLPIPKSMVLNKLEAYAANERFTIENSKILMPQKLVPFSISDINVKGNIMIIKISKVTINSLFDGEKGVKIELDKLKEQLNSLRQKGLTAEQDRKIQEIMSKIDKISNSNSREMLQNIVKEIDNISKNIKDSNTKKEVEKIKEEANKKQEEVSKNEQQAKASLLRLSGQLSAAQSAVSSPKGKQVIGAMVSTISKMASNPSYNYEGDTAAARSLYNKLTTREKNEVKTAIFSNINMSDVGQIRQLLGI